MIEQVERSIDYTKTNIAFIVAKDLVILYLPVDLAIYLME